MRLDTCGKRNSDGLTARQRLAELLDTEAPLLELGLWAAWRMYPEWGDVPAAGVLTAIGPRSWPAGHGGGQRRHGQGRGLLPADRQEGLRAQRIATAFRLPLVYLVDSAGIFLPLQDEIFPDEDDFGRIFRNNAVISAMGIPQYAAVMGNCVAGGAYLPVLSDTLLMTEGSQLYLAGPALVKAAIGQTADPEELGGARMHAQISGTADYREPDDHACLARLRSLIDLLPRCDGTARRSVPATAAGRDPQDLYQIVSADGRAEYDVRDLMACLVDADSLQEFRAEYGRTVVTAYARIERSSGRRGGQPAAAMPIGHGRSADRRRDVRRFGREGGPLRHGVQPDFAADRVPAGRSRIHGRQAGRAVGHHSLGSEAGQRRQQ